MTQNRPAWAVIVAGGQGLRARSNVRQGPKQFAEFGGKQLAAHAVDAFFRHDDIDGIIVVLPKAALDGEAGAQLAAGLKPFADRLTLVDGGETRRSSVLKGLEAVANQVGSDIPDILIHDAARPFASAALIDEVLAGTKSHGAAVPILPVTDTLKSLRGDLVTAGPDRTGLGTVQTPQGFAGSLILEAHRALAAKLASSEIGETSFTDDASVLEWYGHTVAAVPGSPDNIKITEPSDWERAQTILEGRRKRADVSALPQAETRVGHGYDTHRLVPGDGIWLCGCHLPHTHRLSGHSDADIGLHALTDALLGALGEGDIGTHFPPSQAQWKGADSGVFIAHAVDRVEARAGRIVNVDITLIAEAPKIGPHRDAMVSRLADLLRIEASRVSVKATTNETMGFVGRSEGLAAIATACITLPFHG